MASQRCGTDLGAWNLLKHDPLRHHRRHTKPALAPDIARPRARHAPVRRGPRALAAKFLSSVTLFACRGTLATQRDWLPVPAALCGFLNIRNASVFDTVIVSQKINLSNEKSWLLHDVEASSLRCLTNPG